MATFEPLDSPNAAVRAIVRWQRGLTVLLMLAMSVLPALLCGALAFWVAELLGRADLSYLAGLVVVILVWPWVAGQRRIVHSICEMANAADD